jgi:hypothetical protein
MKKLSTMITLTLLLASCADTNAANNTSKSNKILANCATNEEIKALDSRALQSHLMVAALSCGQHDSYNKFMRKYKKEIASQKGTLEGYFNRRYNKDSQNQLNKFMTGLANASSQQSLAMESKEFCKSTSKVFDELNTDKSVKLIKVASNKKFESLHGVKSCR